MTVSAGSSLRKMSRGRGQSSGWTAFDLKQRNKNKFESEVEKDHFPPIGTSDSTRHGDKLIKKKNIPLKPFSSVLLPNETFPPLKEVRNGQKAVLGSDSDGKSRGTTGDVNLAAIKLKEQHLWAENSLIEDILAAVDNHVDKASALLQTMAPAVNFEECKVSRDLRPTTSDDITCGVKTGESFTLETLKNDIAFYSNLVGHLQDYEKESVDRNASPGQKFSDVGDLKCKMDLLNFVPVEPEWEDDDIYISHRRDALKTMRYGYQLM